MSDEIQKAIIFREAIFSTQLDRDETYSLGPTTQWTTGDIMSDEVMEFPKLPELPKEPDPIEKDTLDGWVLVSVYFPSMHALDAGKIIITTYYFKDKKAAEKVKRLTLKTFQEEGLPGMQIIRIRRLNDGMNGLSLSD